MVKLSFLYIIVFVAFAGCCRKQNDYVLVQDNEMLMYVNYIEHSEFEFPFSFFEDYPIRLTFSLDVKEQSNRFVISKNSSSSIKSIIEKFSDRYFEHGEDYCLSEDTSKVYFCFCGKLSLVDGMSSFLISKEIPGDLPDESPKCWLYLFNCKNKRLTSIVQLSVNLSHENNISGIVTYVIDNLWPAPYYFSQINYHTLFEPDSYISIENYLPKKVISDYVTIKKKSKVLYFSTFIIDENGYVELINM